MGAYVFSLGLVPVREWIAQARRSRDLRVGSVFLWHTMARVLARLEDRLQADIWLPRPSPDTSLQKLAGLSFRDALDQDYGIPNRASGACEAEEEQVRETFQELQAGVVYAAWRELREEGFDSLRRIDSKLWKAIEPHWLRYREEVPTGEDCPLTLVWAACLAPHPPDEAHREKNLAVVDRFYADVKRTRPIPAWRRGHPIGKCTQCGQREAVGPTESFSAWRDWHQGTLDANESVLKGHRLDPGERLCYVCLARRLAGYPQGSRKKFPSTGEIAAAAWLRDWEKDDPEVARLLRKLKETEIGREDLGRALYASKRELPGPEGEEVLELRAKIRRAAPEVPPPPGYLALLAFDGDDMGERVRQSSGPMSEAMARFAAGAHERLTSDPEGPPQESWHPPAAVFYLGGDEGLAMVPAAGALDLAADLRRIFRESFESDDPPTLSVGIAFFEHSRPMRGAILAARGALDAAKALDGKNALGVQVETASGNRWGFAAHWGDEWDRIQGAVRLIGDGQLSPGWAYDVERFLETLPPELWRQAVTAARAEVKRLFFRRLRVKGRTAEARQAAKRKAWEDLPGESWWEGAKAGEIPGANPQQFHLIGFLARQIPGALAQELES